MSLCHGRQDLSTGAINVKYKRVTKTNKNMRTLTGIEMHGVEEGIYMTVTRERAVNSLQEIYKEIHIHRLKHRWCVYIHWLDNGATLMMCGVSDGATSWAAAGGLGMVTGGGPGDDLYIEVMYPYPFVLDHKLIRKHPVPGVCGSLWPSFFSHLIF